MMSLQTMCLNEHNERFYGSVLFHKEDLQGNMKLKNELCRNYLQFGFCRYNNKCQFAHGIDELRQNQSSNIRYKTKQCQSFFQKGCCQYGERCNFIHNHQYQQQNHQHQKWRKIKTNFRDIIEEARVKSRFFTI